MKLSVSLTDSERQGGLIYILIDLFVLPAALGILNSALEAPMPAAVLNFVFFSVNFLAVILLMRKFLWKNILQFGKNLPRNLLFAALGFLLYQVANYGISALILHFVPDFANVNDASIAGMMDGHFWLMVIGTVLLVPVAEELLYRGAVFRGLYGKSPALAYCVSTALFSFIHVLSFLGTADFFTICLCFVQYIPAGLIFCRCYEKTDSILTPILIHTAVNLVGILALR